MFARVTNLLDEVSPYCTARSSSNGVVCHNLLPGEGISFAEWTSTMHVSSNMHCPASGSSFFYVRNVVFVRKNRHG